MELTTSIDKDDALIETQQTTSMSSNEMPRDRRYLVRKPSPLQYFHNGVLKKASDKDRVSGKFELFFDLLYVALVANFAEHVSEDPSGSRVLCFVLIFTPAWHAWADEKENSDVYYNDDLVQRIGILWIMAILVLYGNNANFVAEDISALRITLAAYQVVRISQIALFAYYSLASHCHRLQNRLYCLLVVVDMCIWIPVYFETVSIRAKVAIAFISIIFEQLGYLLAFGPWIARWARLEHSTAVDINHQNDRFTAFTIIVLGEFTYAILVNSPARGGLNLNVMRAIWTLVIAFCFNTMYVYQDGSLNPIHPARRSVLRAFLWIMLHLPLSAALLLGGHTSAVATADGEFGPARRWVWGGGLAVSYFCLYCLAWLFKDGDRKGTLVMPKIFRTLPRLLAAIITACLPLASGESLSDTGLISIGAAISVSVVVWEIYGSLEKNASIFEPW